MAATNGAFWTQTFLKPDGTPYLGVRVFHWVDDGGQSTVLDVYQNAQLSAAHNNPVVGDASGRVSFWGNGTYHLVVKTSTADGNLTLYDWPGVELQHRTATVRAEDRAISLPSATLASRGRLFATVDGGGDIGSVYIQRTAAAWLRLLTEGVLGGMLEWAKGADIASTTSVTIPSTGNFFDITGSNTIESFSQFTGYPIIFTRFTGPGLTLTHSSNLQMLNGESRVTVPNEIVGWLHIGSGSWVEIWHTSFPNFPVGSIPAGNLRGSFLNSGTGVSSQALMSGGAGAPSWAYGMAFHGPSSVGAGSQLSQQGAVTYSANQTLSGINLYSTVTINAGTTITIGANQRILCLIASQSITINGTISTLGGGPSGGAGAAAGGNNPGGAGTASTDQPGGAGGTANGSGGTGGGGGSVVQEGIAIVNPGTQYTLARRAFDPWLSLGGASGGGGGASSGGQAGGTGGAGGGTLILIAPSITIGATGTINTSGTAGGTGGTAAGGGGGGGAGNLYARCRTYTNSGTILQAGGTGGAGGNANGQAGMAGIRQILIYG